MRNLNKELIGILHDIDKSLSDIEYVILENKLLDLDSFLKESDVDYHDGYAASDRELNDSLKIVGKGFVIFVDDYDGAKSLSLIKIPSKEDLKLADKDLVNKLVVSGSYHFYDDEDEDDDDDE